MRAVNTANSRHRFSVAVVALALIAAACGIHDDTTHDHEEPLVAADDGHDHGEDAATDGQAADDTHGDHGEPVADGAEFDHHGQPIHDDLYYEKVTKDGVSVEFTMQSFLGIGGRGADLASEIVEGANSSVIFNITDDAGQPIPGLRPLAWMDYQSAGADRSCEAEVAGFLSGALTDRPLVDFNGFFLLALNNSPSISVIDPTVDVGGYTQLYTSMMLTGRGEDWAMTADQRHLVVSIPSNGQVAVADLDAFAVLSHLNVGPNPTTVVLAPDGRTVWVANDTADTTSGVTVVDPDTLEVVHTVYTGTGDHEIAFSPDGRRAFVTNSDAGTMSVIDTANFTEIDEIDVANTPVDVAVSSANGTIYVASVADGDIVVLDGQSHEVIERLAVGTGLASIEIAPGGRWGFAANPVAGKLHIFDVTGNTITHEVAVPGAPDQISFSESKAYVRSRGAAEVTAVPLGDLAEATAVEVATIPVGQQAPAGSPVRSAAAAMLAAPAAGGLFVANPADDQVYLLPEGAQGTSGSFQGHGLIPRAVQLVDRSLQETAPGVFTGKLRIPDAAAFQVAFLLDSPRVVHCFEFTANPGDLATAAGTGGPPDLEIVTEILTVKAGQSLTMQVRLSDASTGEPIDDVFDLQVVASATGGNWSERFTATSVGSGIYEIGLNVPSAGFYRLFFEAASLEATVETFPTALVEAT